MTRTGIDCGLGKALQQEPNGRGINSREPCAITGFSAGVDAMIATHGLTHLALSVRDPERSLRFYSSVFGVREYFRDCDTIHVLGPGPHDVIAFERRPEDAGSPGGIIHFGFRLIRAEDIDADVPAVEDAGGTISSRGEFGPGLPFAFVRDP